MIVSLLLTQTSSLAQSRWTNAFARRHMGMAVQSLVRLALTAGVFWYLEVQTEHAG